MNKTVFISYSWDNEEHKEWVLHLANSLVKNGIDVILDQYDLSAGHEMTYFMEKAMAADKTIVIMTPKYKEKADERSGGAGYEYSLISKSFVESRPDSNDIIPVLRKGKQKNSCPTYLATRIYHDMSNDENFQSDLFKLIRIILDKPDIKKPKLGVEPNFDESIPEVEQSIIDYEYQKEYSMKKKAIIDSVQGVEVFKKAVKVITDGIKSTLNEYQDKYSIKFIVKPQGRYGILFSTVNFTAFFDVDGLATNSTFGSKIILNFFKGPVGLDPSIDYTGKQEVIYRTRYDFDLNQEFQPIFRLNTDRNIILKPIEIVHKAIKDVVLKELELRKSKMK